MKLIGSLRNIFVSTFIFGITGSLSAQSAIDSAKQKIAGIGESDPAYISTCFFIADNYMEVEHYDSAQIWLNKIHNLLPVKENSLNNYFLITRQAEVFYYNNLQQLGLQESRRGLAMAEALKDSFLLADSYNFLGLFNMNIDSSEQAVGFFRKGIPFVKQPPYPPQYLSLSKPHHLFGNMAEAYFKLRKYDSAWRNYSRSLQLASEIEWGRGLAVAYSGLGDVFLQMGETDSAISNYNQSILKALASKDVDVALLSYGGLGKSHMQKGNFSSAFEAMEQGFRLFEENPNMNRFYTLNFLNNAIEVYKSRNSQTELIKALELKSRIEAANIAGNNNQLQTILNAGMANETKLLSLQVAEAKQNQKLTATRFWLVLIGFAFLAAGFLIYRYNQNQRLAVSRLRQKISQDLHDDVGASLSSLQIYGNIAEQSLTAHPEKSLEMMQKINFQSKEILENMNDIVWSMKTGSTLNSSLDVRIKNFAADLLSDGTIDFTCQIPPDADALLNGFAARRNVILICKEALNNMVKYSKATKGLLQIKPNNKDIELLIEDNGIGYSLSNNHAGNGLENMRQRVLELGGQFNIDTEPGRGFRIHASFPLQNLR